MKFLSWLRKSECRI